jgi:putative hydrolase of the HAD superfamily
MVKDIIFDFFGTIVNYDPSLTGRNYEHCEKCLTEKGFVIERNQFIKAFRSAFERLEENSKADLREFHMMEVAQLYFEEEFGVSVEPDIANELIYLFMEEWGNGISYYEGIKDFLEELSENFRLSIISNTHWPPIIHEHLQEMKIHSLFTEIVTSAEHGYRKPHLSIFTDTIDNLSADPQKVLYVGDNHEEDYLGAKNAGLNAILIDKNSRFSHIDCIKISSIFDLGNYLFHAS